MARPRKEIDQKQFEKLCGLQCTRDEICGFFDTTDKTLDSWCKRTYKEGFSATYAKKRGAGKIALRRAMYQNAVEKGNATMQIWLSRNYLGMKEEPDENIDVEDADAFFAEAIGDEEPHD